jgi:hypothetical protein
MFVKNEVACARPSSGPTTALDADHIDGATGYRKRG